MKRKQNDGRNKRPLALRVLAVMLALTMAFTTSGIQTLGETMISAEEEQQIAVAELEAKKAAAAKESEIAREESEKAAAAKESEIARGESEKAAAAKESEAAREESEKAAAMKEAAAANQKPEETAAKESEAAGQQSEQTVAKETAGQQSEQTAKETELAGQGSEQTAKETEPAGQEPEQIVKETEAGLSDPAAQPSETEAVEEETEKRQAEETATEAETESEAEVAKAMHCITFQSQAAKHGTVWTDGTQIDVSSYYREAQQGEKFRFVVTAENGYVVQMVLCGGSEAVQVGEDTYEISVADADVEISVVYKKIELEGKVKQEVFQDADGSLAVKYTVEVTNKTAEGAAKDITVKAVLGKNCSWYSREGQTERLNYVEDLARIPEGLELKELQTYTQEELEPYASAVIWKSETVGGGQKKEYSFFAKVKETVTEGSEMQALFFVEGEKVKKENISWVNEELFAAAQDQEPSEQSFSQTVNDVRITAKAAAGVLPENAVMCATEVENEAADEALRTSAEAEGLEVLAIRMFDITFEDENGQEIQPVGEVAITYENIEVPEGAEEALVYHVEDDGSGQKQLADAETAGGLENISFEADHFTLKPVVFARRNSGEVSVTTSIVADGTEPFDEEKGPGFDTDENNGIVRSLDTLTYMASFDTDGVSLGRAVYFSITLPLTKQKAEIKIDELDQNIFTNLINSETTERGQVLTGEFIVSDSQALVELPLVIYVGAMNQGDIIAPTIRASLDKNISTAEELPFPQVTVSNHD